MSLLALSLVFSARAHALYLEMIRSMDWVVMIKCDDTDECVGAGGTGDAPSGAKSLPIYRGRIARIFKYI